MAIRIEQSTIYENYNNIRKLLELHVEELTVHKDLMVLNPNLEAYMLLEDAGAIYSFFVFDDDVVIGYSINIISKHLHYADLLYSNNDVLFLHKDYRKSSIGRDLIIASEQEAKNRGAKVYMLHAKPNTALDHYLPKAGYGVQDIVYSKVL